MGVELHDFDEFKKFIKTFFITDEDLWKILYYPIYSPLAEEYKENPYDIFSTDTMISNEGNDIHGVVIFGQKNDEILNASVPIVLIDFKSTPTGRCGEYTRVYINFKILLKGTYIQNINYKDEECSRINIIAKLIDDNFNKASVNDLGLIKNIGFEPISINEENSAFSATYRGNTFAYDYINNKNVQNRIFGGDDY